MYIGTNNGFDTVDGGAGSNDKIIAGADGTLIGLASGYSNGVELITANGNADVRVTGTNGNDTLDFSTTAIDGIAEIDGGNNSDTITTSTLSAANYRGGHGNDAFNLAAGDATLLYTGTNNGFDSFSGNAFGDSAVHTILAEANNTVIGLNNGFDNGVDNIDGGGNANVTVTGTGGNDALNFSLTQVTGIAEIDGGNNNDTITTSTLSAASYRGGHGNDAFTLATTDPSDSTLLYSGTNNGFDSFSGNVTGDSAVHSILAEADGTAIGLNNGFANGVDNIDGGGNANVRVTGTNGNDTLDFSLTQVTGIAEIDGGNNNDTIYVSNDHAPFGATNYEGGHGTDTLMYDDAVYDINTGTGEGFLDGSGTVAFTFSGFELFGTF
jgi:hypothetical protein